MAILNYYLCLGSNVGDREANLKKAVSFLKGIGMIGEMSSLYETAPVAMAAGTGYFYNRVLCLSSELSPAALLIKIKEFEKSMGRDIHSLSYLPRVIDIDILLAGDMIVNEKNLIIPHREMHKRTFVMVPLSEIAPSANHPVLKKTAAEILKNLYSKNKVTKLPEEKF